ncbi:type II toxin-antitoxin system VapC family toxin [Rubrolithibacter danxiaensis]|uniref:type II toxin-antitoxin system VapC family toxin n=1 Tax=Rubrolithibacter danxiaensis TaxID=3390805 RepID=UPI003BF87108
MEVILIDTSVWINFFKGIETPASLFLKNNLANIMIATCPVIMQEVLQGIEKDEEFTKISSYFSDFLLLPPNESYTLAKEAAQLYRNLRKKGLTVRKPNDCLIACYAMRNDISLLQDDRDFLKISGSSLLKVISFD